MRCVCSICSRRLAFIDDSCQIINKIYETVVESSEEANTEKSKLSPNMYIMYINVYTIHSQRQGCTIRLTAHSSDLPRLHHGYISGYPQLASCTCREPTWTNLNGYQADQRGDPRDHSWKVTEHHHGMPWHLAGQSPGYSVTWLFS